jgi:hypothetical protein
VTAGGALLLARMWGLGHTAILAAVLAGAVFVAGDERTSVPTLRTAVLVSELAPALGALLLCRPLVDSYETVYDVAPRRPAPTRTVRWLSVLVLVSAVAAADRTPVGVAPFLAFLAVAAAVTPWLRTLTWLPLLVLGYGWLQLVATGHDPRWLAGPVGCGAASALGLAGYLAGYAWRDHRRRTTPARQRVAAGPGRRS